MQKNGFSLVELLVVISIIGVILTIGFLNFPAMRRQIALERAAHQLVQEIRRAQGMAMSAIELKEEDCPSSPLQFAKGYGIYINLDPSVGSDKNYGLYADTTAGTDCQFPDTSPCWEYYNLGDCMYKSISIEEKGIIIKQINNIDIGSTGTAGVEKVSINFRPPNPDTNIKWLALIEEGVDIVLAIESDPDDLLNQKTITVNRAGLINIK
ncbi:type II secretion system GspH family protein [Patescibacteria group bacterium]|nr:type II secretion system GspH family protein [Patescibacteria group bacterium]